MKGRKGREVRGRREETDFRLLQEFLQSLDVTCALQEKEKQPSAGPHLTAKCSSRDRSSS